MAITFDWYENPGTNQVEEKDRNLHPRLVMNGTLTFKQLCDELQLRSSLSIGDVLSVIDGLSTVMGESLADGRRVHIEGVGYFVPTLEATEKVTASTAHKHSKVRLKGISFRPDKKLNRRLVEVKVKQSALKSHSAKLSDDEIDRRLEAYFAEHDVMIRLDFQQLCTFTRSWAIAHLRRLQDEGKLKNVGRPRQPIYRPQPGYYGLSEDARLARR